MIFKEIQIQANLKIRDCARFDGIFVSVEYFLVVT